MTGAGARPRRAAGVAAATEPGAAVAGTGVAVEPQAVTSSTLAIANPMTFLRIDDLLHV